LFCRVNKKRSFYGIVFQARRKKSRAGHTAGQFGYVKRSSQFGDSTK
jgi:hypothetical protein